MARGAVVRDPLRRLGAGRPARWSASRWSACGRLAHRIVWVNPRKAAPGYAPLVGGMAAALPYCDALVSGHSLAALTEVVDVVGRAADAFGEEDSDMEFDNTFAVTAPIDEVRTTLMDVERVAPCVPGAQVLEQTSDDAYKVAIKVKLGPMSMTYGGERRDHRARRGRPPGGAARQGEGGARAGHRGRHRRAQAVPGG